MKDGVLYVVLECSTQSTSTGCRGRTLEAYFAYTMTCGGEAIDNSVFYTFEKSLRIVTFITVKLKMLSSFGDNDNRKEKDKNKGRLYSILVCLLHVGKGIIMVIWLIPNIYVTNR